MPLLVASKTKLLCAQVSALLHLSSEATWVESNEQDADTQPNPDQACSQPNDHINVSGHVSRALSGCQSLCLADVKAHCISAGLSRYKVPQAAVGQHNPLPTNASGKVQKLVVKDILLNIMLGREQIALSKL